RQMTPFLQCRTSSSVQNFDGKRDTLTAADAKRDKAAREAVSAHRVDEFRGEHCTGRADRVAMGDGTALDIDDVLRQSELAGNHDGDGGKGLIDLGALDGADVPTSALYRLLHRRDRSEAEHAGLTRRNTVRDEASRGGEAALVGPCPVRE